MTNADKKEFFEQDKYEDQKQTFLEAKEWNRVEQERCTQDKTKTDFG